MRRSMVKVVRTVHPIFYFDNKMIKEEEMEKQVNDGTFDLSIFRSFGECAYVYVKDDDICA